MLLTSLCWWLYDGDWFQMLVAEPLCWRLFSLCWWFSQCNGLLNRSSISWIGHQHLKLVTNIWSPTCVTNIDVTLYISLLKGVYPLLVSLKSGLPNIGNFGKFFHFLKQAIFSKSEILRNLDDFQNIRFPKNWEFSDFENSVTLAIPEFNQTSVPLKTLALTFDTCARKIIKKKKFYAILISVELISVVPFPRIRSTEFCSSWKRFEFRFEITGCDSHLEPFLVRLDQGKSLFEKTYQERIRLGSWNAMSTFAVSFLTYVRGS